MTIDKNSLSLLGRIGAWGRPWHGLVTGGSLALPNGSTMAHAQPSGVFHWEHSAAHRLIVPGTPAVERSTEQAAADAAAGRQWRDYAILSGGTALLYGVPLGRGRFVWVDSAGDRWLVNASALDNTAWTAGTIPSSVSITIQRFGVFGIPAASPVSITVSVPDLGQSSPDLYSDNSTVQTGFFTSLYSVHPQGSRAAFMLHYLVSNGYPSTRHPCGWYELQLSGTGASPTAVIERIADRLQTLGGVGESDSDPGAGGVRHGLHSKETITDTTTSSPSCSGYRTITMDYMIAPAGGAPAGWVPLWQYSPGFTQLGMISSFSDDRSISWDGMLLAIWYAENGDRQTLTLDFSLTHSGARTATGLDSTGQRVTRRESIPSGGGCTLGPVEVVSTYSITLSMTETCSESMEYALKINGVPASAKSLEFTASSSGTVNYTHDAWAVDSTANYALSGPGWDGESNASGTRSVSDNQSAGALRDVIGVNVFALSSPFSNPPGKRAIELQSRTRNTSFFFDADQRALLIRPVRLGHSVFGWLFGEDLLGGTTTWTLDGLVTPDGSASSPAWSHAQDSTIYSPTSVLYAAQDPESSAVSLGTTPRCWV